MMLLEVVYWISAWCCHIRKARIRCIPNLEAQDLHDPHSQVLTSLQLWMTSSNIEKLSITITAIHVKIVLCIKT